MIPEFGWLLETLQELMVEFEAATESSFGSIEPTETGAVFQMKCDASDDLVLIRSAENGISFYRLDGDDPSVVAAQGENLVCGLDLIAEIIVAVWR